VKREIELAVSCHDCVRRGTPDCGDCLVSFVLGEAPDELVIHHDESELVRLLTNEGLVPKLRFHGRVALGE
jgi:hypothetical protein